MTLKFIHIPFARLVATGRRTGKTIRRPERTSPPTVGASVATRFAAAVGGWLRTCSGACRTVRRASAALCLWGGLVLAGVPVRAADFVHDTCVFDSCCSTFLLVGRLVLNDPLNKAWLQESLNVDGHIESMPGVEAVTNARVNRNQLEANELLRRLRRVQRDLCASGSFDEAAELAYFGAKILHPATIQPCKDKGIAVLLKNTMDPKAPGTTISDRDDDSKSFHAVAAKDGITVIRIHSARMLMAYGFLRKVFEIFEQYRTPIDMITTSEVAVSLTVDNDKHIDEIVAELEKLGTIEIERNNSIVCVVGRMEHGDAGLAASVFKSVQSIPIKMISYGASHRSLAMLISTEYKKQTLQSLNDGLFE